MKLLSTELKKKCVLLTAALSVLAGSVQRVDAVEHLTVVTSKGGELKDKVLSSDFDGLSSLRVEGPVNAEDWGFLTSNTGIMASVKELDLSKIELVLDGSTYASYSDPTGSMGVSYNYRWNAWPRDSIDSGSTLAGPLTTIWGRDLSLGFIETDFEKIILPESNEGVGRMAFLKCNNLKEVVFSGKEKYIESDAFKFDKSLQTVNIPASVERLGMNAFYETSSLSTIDLSGVAHIGYSCFGKSGLMEVKNTGQLETIDEFGFYLCEHLGSIDIPGRVKEIGCDAFYFCTSLKDVALGEGVEVIADGAFSKCESLTQIALPSTVRKIGKSAFLNCKTLDNISIPDGLVELGRDAFNNTPFIKKFGAENGIIYIGKVAYQATKDLPARPVIKDGTVSLCDNLFASSAIESVSLPSSLLHIGKEAFYNCKKLSDITLPENLESIGDEAFRETYLSQINLPQSLRVIGDKAFLLCGLTYLSLPDKIEKIGESAFGENNFMSLTLPESITEIGDRAFGDNTKLVRINYNCINALSEGPFQGPFGGSSCDILVLGDKVESIPDGFFDGVTSSVKEIVFPESVKRIGDSAFSYKRELTAITIPENVEYIGSQAFSYLGSPFSLTYNCRHAETAPDGYNISTGMHYETQIFQSTSISELHLGDNVEYLMPNIFKNQENISHIELKNVKEIGESAFSSCKSLANVKLPECLEVIGDNAFSGCSKAFGSDLSLPGSLSVIGKSAFYGIGQIGRVFIPAGVESIGENAFMFVTGNQTQSQVYYYSNMNEPPVSDGNIFGASSDSKLRTVYIPHGSRNAYRANHFWRESGELIEQEELTCDSERVLNVDFKDIAGKSGDACRGIITGGAYFMNVAGSADGSSVKIAATVDTNNLDKWYAADFSTYDIADNFSGIYMKLPGCKGRIEIDVMPRCTLELRTDYSSDAAVVSDGYKRQTIGMDFDFSEPTGAWIYNSTASSMKGTAEIYSIIVTPDGAGVENICAENSDIRVVASYTPDGVRVDNPAKGTLIIERLSNGTSRKVIAD